MVITHLLTGMILQAGVFYVPSFHDDGDKRPAAFETSHGFVFETMAQKSN